MSKTSQAEQAGILVWGRTVSTIADAVIPLVIVRLFGKAELGGLLAVLYIYQSIALICAAGFPATVMYFLPGKSPPERRAVSMVLFKTVLRLATVASLIIFGVAGFHASVGFGGTELPLEYLAIFGIYPLVDLPVRLVPNLLLVEGRVKAVATLAVFQTVGKAVCMVTPAALGFPIWCVCLSLVGFGFVYAVVVWRYVKLVFDDVPVVPAEVSPRELLRFAWPIGATDIVSIVNQRLDRLILMVMVVAATVFAEYEAGAWQIPFLTAIPYAIGAAYTPRFRELFSKGEFDHAIDVWRLSIDKVSLVVVPSAVLFFVCAEEAMVLLFGPEYISAAPIFRCYCLLTMGRVATFGSVLVAAGASKDVLKAAAFMLVSNLALSIPLAMWLGFIGPALGSALAFIPTVFAYCWFIARATGRSVTKTFPLVRYCWTVLLAATASLPAYFIKSSIEMPAGVAIAVLGLVTLLGFALLGSLTGRITREDWAYVRDWLQMKAIRR